MTLLETIRTGLADRYDIEREIDGDGLSRQFAAQERALNRPVVIKILPPSIRDSVDVDQFHRTVGALLPLSHQQIVPVYRSGTCGDLLYYVMPPVEGETLRDFLARHQRMKPQDVTSVLVPLARALSYAHRHGAVHRDIRPENILLVNGAPKYADFVAGMVRARIGSSASLAADASPQALVYTAPELVESRREADSRADVYALATLGFELLAGVPPYSGSPQQVMSALVVAPVPDITAAAPVVPLPLSYGISAGLVKDPDSRPDAATFGYMLAEGPSLIERALPPRRRTGLLLSLLAVLVILALAFMSARGGDAP